MEILLALPQGIVFFNDDYQQRHRLIFSDQRFKAIKPQAADDAHGCRFLAYRFHQGAYLFDLEGKEIWKFIRRNNREATIDGVCYANFGGGEKPGFVIYQGYRTGIKLVDIDGTTRWEHPVQSLGYVEISDVYADSEAEVIYTNSNNAKGVTEFTFLDAQGTVAKQLNVHTTSSEFAVVRWPQNGNRPNILLTEDGKIRIIDSSGDTAMLLDAPGCRTYGQVKAVTVKFRKNEPQYLAVRKRLHPDLAVLYVYDADGKLVYQKTDVVEYMPAAALAAVPANGADDTEKLLVGSSRHDKALVLEYSLTR